VEHIYKHITDIRYKCRERTYRKYLITSWIKKRNNGICRKACITSHTCALEQTIREIFATPYTFSIVTPKK
jgi:hypothetical protein